MELNIGDGVLFKDTQDVREPFPKSYSFFVYEQLTDDSSGIYKLESLPAEVGSNQQ